ncbi:MAG: P1 family peptidase [Acidobacteriota bacterium]
MNRRRFLQGTVCGLSLLPAGALLEEILQAAQETGPTLSTPRKRLRELGAVVGTLDPGRWNALTDVPGVRVGHTTIVKGEGRGAVRTGVSVILPHDGNIWEENLYAGYFDLNGWGEMTGIQAVTGTGLLSTPVFLTGTYNVGIVYSAALEYLKKTNRSLGSEGRIAYPVVAECFDDFLSDTRSRQVSDLDVFRAIDDASTGPVVEGAVGGGTGMTAFGFKGGIGTSSRVVDKHYKVGVLVMANTGSRSQLRIDGFPVGREIRVPPQRQRGKSIILLAATDAPLLPYQLRKLAKRVGLGLGQVGAISGTGSGDIVLAFSTARRIPRKSSSAFHKLQAVSDFYLTPFYQAAVEATQEAILNALTMAQTTVGRDGNTAYGIPLDQVQKILQKYYGLGRGQGVLR